MVTLSSESLSRTPIIFRIEGLGEADGELIRHLAPRTVGAILKRLPLEGRCMVWKEELYFQVPIVMGEEKSSVKVERGDVAYWPMGNAICIFFGKTQPYSPVNPVGKIKTNLDLLRRAKVGSRVKLERA